MGFSGNFRSLIDVSGNLALVESGGFLKCRVDISGNLRLIDLSGFPKFQFRVRAVRYKVFLFITGGGK